MILAGGSLGGGILSGWAVAGVGDGNQQLVMLNDAGRLKRGTVHSGQRPRQLGCCRPFGREDALNGCGTLLGPVCEDCFHLRAEYGRELDAGRADRISLMVGLGMCGRDTTKRRV